MKRKQRQPFIIPTGSMADIAFLLLIFFLVTTTIANEQGIMVKLPVWDPNVMSTSINERNVLNIYLNHGNQLMVENEIIPFENLGQFVQTFILNLMQSDQMPLSPEKTIISLKNDRGTSYEKYILVYDQIRKVYTELQNEKSIELYGRSFELCSLEEKSRIRKIYPMVISEMEESDFLKQ